MSIEIKNFEKHLLDFTLYAHFTLDAGEWVGVQAPSGFGKSTLLRWIAGFEGGAKGQLCVDGMDVTGTEIRRRGFGVALQSPVIFDAVSVEENLRIAQSSTHRKAALSDFLPEKTGYKQWLNLSPSKLSGGEAQRVSLIRTLLMEPKLLLWDEPLSSLDEASKVILGEYIAQWRTKHPNIPAIVVSHSSEDFGVLGISRILSKKEFYRTDKMRQGF